MSYPGCYASSSPVAKPSKASLAKGIITIAILADMYLADKHQVTCPDCAGKEYWQIALSVRHLLRRR